MLRLVVYSDFLCPWCWNVATRLASVQQQLGRRARAASGARYLLRPYPQPGRDLEKFRAYTRSWLRVAEDEPRAPFQVWASDAGPPSHSVPAHVIAKAAAALGAGRRRAHARSPVPRVLRREPRHQRSRHAAGAVAAKLELPDAAFAEPDDPALTRAVLADHDEAQSLGATGVPAVRLADQDFVLVGAQPEAVYLRWLRRVLDAGAATA